jgi:hypothetical protein
LILCGSTRRALVLRGCTGPILLLGRLSALLLLGRGTRRLARCVLALCAGTASILLLRLSARGFLLPAFRSAQLIAVALALSCGLVFFGLATLGLIPIAFAFRSARLIAVTFALAYGLTFLALVLLGLATGLTTIDRSLALALSPTAFPQSLSSALALRSFAALSARAPGHFAAQRAASGRAGRHPVFAAPARATAGPTAHAAALHTLC